MKKLVLSFFAIVFVFTAAIPVLAKNARFPAIEKGADRLVELQRTDTGWEGTWYWYLGSTYNATNLTGVTTLGLLEAYQDTKDESYLNAAIDAAEFIMKHLGVGATGDQYRVRATAPDIIFLYRLSETTGNSAYFERAKLEWENIKSAFPTASSLDTLFRNIGRRSAWDIAFFLEAAYLSNDSVWADEAAAILANTEDDFYYGETWWYALNLGGSIRALVDCGYADKYKDSIVFMLNELVSLSDKDNGIGGWAQDTAYGILAFRAVGGAGHQYANELARWLARNQDEMGGWIEGGFEYPEVNGEVVRALSSTIGKNVGFEGWKVRDNIHSSWKKTVKSIMAVPFSGE